MLNEGKLTMNNHWNRLCLWIEVDYFNYHLNSKPSISDMLSYLETDWLINSKHTNVPQS